MTPQSSNGGGWYLKVLASVMAALVTAALVGGYMQLRNSCSKSEMQAAINSIRFPYVADKPFLQAQLTSLTENQRIIQKEVKDLQISSSTNHATVMTKLEAIYEKMGVHK